MINHAGFFAILDRGITLNWEDGATLHKFGAAVRYHLPDSVNTRQIRLSASHRYSDDPLAFVATADGLRAVWVWQERPPGWTAMLSLDNAGDQDVFLDSLDVLRLDSEFGGLFNLGAPPGLWRCRVEYAAGVSGLLPPSKATSATSSPSAEEGWESWSPGTMTASGFVRARELIVQPTVSNRSRPPAVMIRALRSAHDLPTELRLEITGERFERFVARCKTEGRLLAPGSSIASPPFWVVAGDDAEELHRLSPELTDAAPV